MRTFVIASCIMVVLTVLTGIFVTSVGLPLEIISPNGLPPAKTGKEYTYQLRVKGGHPPYVWGGQDGSMGQPIIHDDGQLIWIPDSGMLETGIIVEVRDSRGLITQKMLHITVSP